MIKLLITDNSKLKILDDSSFGGLPVTEIGKNTEWPKCKTCETEMQYLGKIKTDIGDWDADSGGNKVTIVNSDLLEFTKPIDRKLSLRETEYGVKLVEVKEDDYDNARENWTGNRREVLGQSYGEPVRLQGDQTPTCECCNKPMRFVAQLEQGPDHKTEMNFGGGGVAYLFDCIEGRTAKFLWQS